MTLREILRDRFIDLPPILFALFKARLQFFFLTRKRNHLLLEVNDLLRQNRMLRERLGQPLLVDGRQGNLLKQVEQCHGVGSPQVNGATGNHPTR
jgi:hypothetical protein